MAPVGEKGSLPRSTPLPTGKGSSGRMAKKSKRRWIPPEARKKFEGSTSEGQGFAFRRKQKIEQQYKKLLKKEKIINPARDIQFTENYPEHLKHLYLAEEEMLKKQKRKTKDDHERDRPTLPDPKDCRIVESNITNQTKFKKKTSNLKAKEEYEAIQAKRAKKREEALKRNQEREEAQKLYKQKKMESYKILSKKTKKGQPNLNLQMEYLLQKIQQNK
ncbi:thyroid transcription factor 1-associated protein 26 [Ambystoma mexicanum]|uniref:thyroid transcription factor 1-associated protein 26 n=1 Tax=Ambystoma mexicanum TaxID=8296 RepID=UPI0037E8845B